MEPLALFMTGLFVLLLVGVVLLGIFAPGNGARQLRWHPTRSPELEAQNELDDLDQMLESVNARRRARPARAHRAGAARARRRRPARPRGPPPVRLLLVGSSCRGLDLARELGAGGHAVRAVTRSEDRRAELEAAGCECWIGDPDRIGTLRYALDNVTLVLWLLGTASGEPDRVAALHGPRLRMMLEKVTDTTVRGVVYEAAGTLPEGVLEQGVREVEHARRTNEIPFTLLRADPRGNRGRWLAEARAAIDGLVGERRAA